MKLHLGSGHKLKEGYLNIDMVDIVDPRFLKWDLRQGFPSHINNVEFIYSEHFWEHLTHEEGCKLMSECFNIMKAGAKIKIVVPCFKILANAYVNNNLQHFAPISFYSPKNRMMEYVINSLYQWGEHKCHYDAKHLIDTLTDHGFKNAKEVEFDPSQDSFERRQFSCYVEAEK